MHPGKAYSLPSLLLMVGLCQLGLQACSGNAKLGGDNEPTTAAGGVGSGGTTAANSTTAGAGNGGSLRLPQLPKACPGLAFDTAAVDAGTKVDADAGKYCAGIGIPIGPTPLDILIMMDRSDSMTRPVSRP